MKVLISCLFYRDLTGSELYVYELARNLIKIECDVSIFSPNAGGILTEMSEKLGLKVYNNSNLPINETFDIIHCQHTPVVTQILSLFPTTKKICTIHSEIYPLEYPVIDPTILKYIAIRPEIKVFLNKKFKIPYEQIELIYNPIDETRFNIENLKEENYVLFVGTLDFVRKNTIFDLVHYTKILKKELWIIGKNHSNYLEDLKQYPHVKYFNELYNVEEYVKNCSETAGILLGRTTIEGWMCGKPGWIYNVDPTGKILDKRLRKPPVDIEKFHSKNVANQIKQEYLTII